VAWVSAVARVLEPLRYRRDAAGQVVESVRAEVDDTYLATIGFANEAVGQLLWSWAGRGAPLDIAGAPAFYGSEGAIVGGQLYDSQGRGMALMETFDSGLTADERERFFPLGLTDPYAIQQLDWLRAIDAGTDPETSGEEGLRDLACAFAILESSMSGTRVQTADVLAGRSSAYQREIDEHYGV
jgi:predicted dehydrogenase